MTVAGTYRILGGRLGCRCRALHAHLVTSAAEEHAVVEIELEPPREGGAGEPFRGVALRARVAGSGERDGGGGDHHDLFRHGHAAARSANFAYRFRNESFIASVGPLRCLARITSARPCWSDSSL